MSPKYIFRLTALMSKVEVLNDTQVLPCTEALIQEDLEFSGDLLQIEHTKLLERAIESAGGELGAARWTYHADRTFELSANENDEKADALVDLWTRGGELLHEGDAATLAQAFLDFCSDAAQKSHCVVPGAFVRMMAKLATDTLAVVEVAQETIADLEAELEASFNS